jgi:hypothetical protein
MDDLFAYERRKSLHIALFKGTHLMFKSEVAKYNLSMQEAIEEFASLVAEGDSRAISIIEELLVRKRAGASTKRILKKNVEDLYDMIEGGLNDNA